MEIMENLERSGFFSEICKSESFTITVKHSPEKKFMFKNWVYINEEKNLTNYGKKFTPQEEKRRNRKLLKVYKSFWNGNSKNES